jgi:hypothetical protein
MYLGKVCGLCLVETYDGKLATFAMRQLGELLNSIVKISAQIAFEILDELLIVLTIRLCHSEAHIDHVYERLIASSERRANEQDACCFI